MSGKISDITPDSVWVDNGTGKEVTVVSVDPGKEDGERHQIVTIRHASGRKTKVEAWWFILKMSQRKST